MNYIGNVENVQKYFVNHMIQLLMTLMKDAIRVELTRTLEGMILI